MSPSPSHVHESWKAFSVLIVMIMDRIGIFRDLAAVRKDSNLDKDEFSVAMYLIKQRKSGKELPDTLPLSLVPPALRGFGKQDVVLWTVRWVHGLADALLFFACSFKLRVRPNLNLNRTSCHWTTWISPLPLLPPQPSNPARLPPLHLSQFLNRSQDRRVRPYRIPLLSCLLKTPVQALVEVSIPFHLRFATIVVLSLRWLPHYQSRGQEPCRRSIRCRWRRHVANRSRQC